MDSDLCQYQHIFGKPGEGAHFHVYGIAIVDVLLTLIGALAISKYCDFGFWKTLIFILLLSVFLHYIFCVPTTSLRLLGLAS